MNLTTHSSAQFQTLGDNHKAIEERINLLGQNDLTLIRLIDKNDASILSEINAINNEMETLLLKLAILKTQLSVLQ